MIKKLFVFLLLINVFNSNAQDYYINITEKWNSNTDKIMKNTILKNAVDTFFKYKDSTIMWKFCLQADLTKWGYYPFMDIRQMEKRFSDDFPLFPTLLGAIQIDSTTDAKKYLVKIAYTSNDDSIHNSLSCVYNFIVNVNTKNASFTFERYSNQILQSWYKKQVGTILYYKAHEADFNIQEAESMNSFNDSIAKVWNVEPVKCVYFSCKNPVELFKLKGFDYIYNMFLAPSGGQAAYGAKDSEFEHIIYSGNDKEYYPHEICHFYIYKFSTNQSTLLAVEGIATLLGGSSEKPYTFHANALKRYLDENKDKSIFDFFFSNNNFRLNEHTSALYATGAVIADMLYEKNGIKGLKSFLAIPTKELRNELPKLLGTSSEKAFTEKIRNHLKKYQ